MAFTRKYLEALGLTESVVEAVIAAHTEVTDGLKKRISELEPKAAQFDARAGEKDWKAEYEREHGEFESYKQTVAGREADAAKVAAYKSLLGELKIGGKLADTIVRGLDLKSIELDASGKIKGADALGNAIKAEWSEYIPTEKDVGIDVATPPVSGGTVRTREEILAIKDPVDRRAAIAEQPELFGIQ